jgi:uncharacterized protein (TIGR02599 family)
VKKSIRGCGSKRRQGFTLVELLVATVVLLLIMAILLSLTTQAGNLWRTTTTKLEQFRGARDAFEDMTRRLSQATLNTYWDYYPNATTPTSYVRQSELRFISGNTVSLAGTPAAPRQWPTHGVFFQAPLGFSQDPTTYGLDNLLNTWGYFIEFSSDTAQRPGVVPTTIVPLRYRYRLCELMQPTNSLSIYSYTSGINASTGVLNTVGYTGRDWFSDAMNLSDTSTTPVRPVHVLAENIIALIILPKLSPNDEQSLVAAGTIPNAPLGTSLAPNYTYDSTVANSNAALDTKNQLPPLIQVTMVAINEASAIRLAQGQGTTMPTFGLSTAVFNNLFTNATQMAADLATLEQALENEHIVYRVFSTNLAIKGAKWSRDETN